MESVLRVRGGGPPDDSARFRALSLSADGYLSSTWLPMSDILV
ncbi:Uncharacterized protein dnm_021990 [Desulfonema magnum]|uniref:Uncharacterized protein n=1 Tax=Desulfonema magnum TaxID=45655 RepID=A0A975BIX5_9BACT|nr:Uncharacterized protein dnm_021990 [Desulfonema magnum]